PGSTVYLQVELAAPGALPMFTVWVAAEQALMIATQQNEQARDKVGAQKHRDDDLIREWQEIVEIQSGLGNAAAQALNILAGRLREARIDNPYGWAQERLSALRNEARR